MTNTRLYRRLSALILLTALTIGTASAQTRCGAPDESDDIRFTQCVDAVAAFACRSSTSISQMLNCFTDSAREMVGPNYNGTFTPDCVVQNSVSAGCSIVPGWGAGDEWCYRTDAGTIKYCEGDPPNHRCKIYACKLGDEHCNTKSLKSGPMSPTAHSD